MITSGTFYDSSMNLLSNDVFTRSEVGDGVEILVSFWFKNWDHMSWMYGEGLSDRIRRVVSDFLAILPCDLFILLDLLFGILCDISHRFRFPLVVHHLVLRYIIFSLRVLIILI